MREGGAVAGRNVGGHGRAGEQQAGEVEDGVDPVGPSGDESVERAKSVARPGVNAAFLGKARRKLVDDQRAGDEEKESSQHPQADGRSAVVPGGGDPARPEDSGDVEEQHIPEAHGLAQLRFGIARIGRGDGHGGL